MAVYPTRATIELIHGCRNITIWADLDNDKNTTIIAARIEWAADVATEYLNGRLIMGRYTLPFSAVPKMVIHISSLLAGILLHDGRPMMEHTRDMVGPKRKEFRRLVKELLSGQLKLTDPTSGEIIESECKTFPETLESENLYTALSRTGVCNTCWCHTCVCRSITLPCW